MIRTSLIALLLTSIACSWCGKDFVSLGRHSWRFRSKVNHEDINSSRSSSNKTLGTTTTQPVIEVNQVQCSCKGHRGLKAHQRSCKVIHRLNSDLLKDLDTEINNSNSTDTSNTSTVHPSMGLTNGLPFPKSPSTTTLLLLHICTIEICQVYIVI